MYVCMCVCMSVYSLHVEPCCEVPDSRMTQKSDHTIYASKKLRLSSPRTKIQLRRTGLQEEVGRRMREEAGGRRKEVGFAEEEEV